MIDELDAVDRWILGGTQVDSYVRQSWYKLRAKLVEGQKPSTNSRYAAALQVLMEYNDISLDPGRARISINGLAKWIEKRLNAETGTAHS